MSNRAYMMVHRFRLAIVVLVFAGLLAACARQLPTDSGGAPGFFRGLFHGFTILFSLIGSTFTENRIYAYPNSGGWYDLGYFLGASMFLGGGGAGARGK